MPQSGDGCDAFCQLEEGFTCTTLVENEPVDTVCEVIADCGDGEPTGEEECDDGNNDDGDGCSAVCQIDPDTDIFPGPTTPSNDPAPTFEITDPTGDAVTFYCAQDGVTFVECPGTYAWTGDLVSGDTYTLTAYGEDADGNVDGTPDTWTWTYIDDLVRGRHGGPARGGRVVVRRWPSSSSSPTVTCSVARVAQFTDDNEDDVIDENDTPDVVVVGTDFFSEVPERARLPQRRHRRGRELPPGPWYPASNLLVVDLDGDDELELVLFTGALFDETLDSYVVALEVDGTPLSISNDGDPASPVAIFNTATSDTLIPMVSAADLNADGVPEVLAHNLVLDGQTGLVLADLAATGTSFDYSYSVAADLDLANPPCRESS